MYPRTFAAIAVIAILVGTGAPVGAQTLADVARRADAAKKAAGKSTGGKTYTNKDVGDVPPATAQTLSGAPADAAKPADGATKPADGLKPADGSQPKDGANASGAKDQQYYANRMKDLRGKLDRDQAFLSALVSQINALNTDFINRDDPVQKSAVEQNRNKALAQQAQLQKDIQADQKAISDFQEEARKAGAPAGWLR